MGARAGTIEDKKQRKQQLLEVAKRFFFEKGYQGTTIEMITAEVGLSPGAFYGYFKSKLEIYLTLYSEAIDIFHGLVLENRWGGAQPEFSASIADESSPRCARAPSEQARNQPKTKVF